MIKYPSFIEAPASAIIGQVRVTQFPPRRCVADWKTSSQKCFSSLLENLNFEDTECIKYAISKGLGLAIVAGGAVVKIPQIAISEFDRHVALAPLTQATIVL